MKEDSCFAKALGNFTFDAACGGAIRHLADLGLSAEAIKEKLSYPTSMDKIIHTYTEYLLKQGIIAVDLSGDVNSENCEFVCEQGTYGKTSFRKVTKQSKEGKRTYLRCSFTNKGVLKDEFLSYLPQNQIAYLQSIDWKRGIHYHVLNEQMKEIQNQVPTDVREKFFQEDNHHEL